MSHRWTLGEEGSEVFSCKYDPEDRYLACGYGDGIIRIYNMETRKISFNLATHAVMHDERPITGIKWRP